MQITKMNPKVVSSFILLLVEYTIVFSLYNVSGPRTELRIKGENQPPRQCRFEGDGKSNGK